MLGIQLSLAEVTACENTWYVFVEQQLDSGDPLGCGLMQA